MNGCVEGGWMDEWKNERMDEQTVGRLENDNIEVFDIQEATDN